MNYPNVWQVQPHYRGHLSRQRVMMKQTIRNIRGPGAGSDSPIPCDDFICDNLGEDVYYMYVLFSPKPLTTQLVAYLYNLIIRG
jgi:hypothetical protein